ncbi:MAG: type II toxin-antitoxin system VapC family toxin [Propionibacteriaceae bacterium]|jgi:predicted nucleic acid-binding protein|nr:type II toxin-antitoxin system VapC family toxin [Propionibacteriaceae bacterium]
MAETRWALDTSVAVPLLIASHEAHPLVSRWASGKTLCVCGHALAETYSVLTRLPGDARLSSADAVTLMDANFVDNVTLSTATAKDVHRELARYGIVGGAVYDGLVALAARDHRLTLVTRDARARSTYEAVGAHVELLVSSSF